MDQRAVSSSTIFCDWTESSETFSISSTESVGKGKWTVMLTADHGVLDSPEDLQARGEYGHRLTAAERATLDSLRAEADRASDPKAAAVKLRNELKKLPIIGDAWTHEQLDSGQPADSFEVLQRHSRSVGREEGWFSREGVEIRFVPGLLTVRRGSSHGTPYYYDRHVPMIFMGPGIRPGRDASRARTIDFAPTFAAILGIPYPADLDGPGRCRVWLEENEQGKHPRLKPDQKVAEILRFERRDRANDSCGNRQQARKNSARVNSRLECPTAHFRTKRIE